VVTGFELRILDLNGRNSIVFSEISVKELKETFP
jgi:hypothetical protein